MVFKHTLERVTVEQGEMQENHGYQKQDRKEEQAHIV